MDVASGQNCQVSRIWGRSPGFCHFRQGRRNRCGRSGGRRNNVPRTNHKIIIIIIIITVLRTLDSFTTRIWTGNETIYSTYLTSLRSKWLRRTFLPNSFNQRKRFVLQSDSLVVRVTRGVSTLCGMTRLAGCIIRCQCRRCLLLPWYARRAYTKCSQIAIILQPES